MPVYSWLGHLWTRCLPFTQGTEEEGQVAEENEKLSFRAAAVEVPTGHLSMSGTQKTDQGEIYRLKSCQHMASN